MREVFAYEDQARSALARHKPALKGATIVGQRNHAALRRGAGLSGGLAFKRQAATTVEPGRVIEQVTAAAEILQGARIGTCREGS